MEFIGGGVTFPGSLEQPLRLARVDDQAPVLLGRLKQEELDLNAGAECAKELEIGWRQGRDAKDRDPLRHIQRPEVGRGRAFTELLQERRQMLPRLLLMQASPKRRLPKLMLVFCDACRARLALIPGEDQVGAEHQILVKEVGDLPGELEAFADISRVRKITLQRAEFRPGDQLRQPLHDRPQHYFAVKCGLPARTG